MLVSYSYYWREEIQLKELDIIELHTGLAAGKDATAASVILVAL